MKLNQNDEQNVCYLLWEKIRELRDELKAYEWTKRALVELEATCKRLGFELPK